MPPKKPTTEPPAIDPVVLDDLQPGDAYDLGAEADLEGFEITDLRLDRLDLHGATVFSTRLDQVRADEADLGAVTLTEVVLGRLDVPVVRGTRGRWREVEVLGARLGSAELYESSWAGVRFVGCKLGFVNLRGASLRDVVFTDCTIDELDLVASDALRVAFEGTRGRRLDVPGATVAHVDLRGAEIDELGGIESLRGSTIDSMQLARLAATFAHSLGITVTD
ncbi:MAG: pentapeptide repeat-containing protein [Cellulosimicrobium funkei]|uniref:pentapeptide repeat-containing protein n=1 Tax=Cellulosimicrobium funkei TaxID=264251 RepID=UPI003F9CE93D